MMMLVKVYVGCDAFFFKIIDFMAHKKFCGMIENIKRH